MRSDPSTSNKSAHVLEESVILVVHDSPVIRLALNKMLQRQNYRILEAGSGEEAWKAIKNEPSIQMIFSGLSMPNDDDLRLLASVRNSDIDRINRLPFVVIKGTENDEKSLQRAMDSGATDMVSKPFQSSVIKECAKTYTSSNETSDKEGQASTAMLDDIAESLNNLSSIDKLLNLEKQGLTGKVSEFTDSEITSEALRRIDESEYHDTLQGRKEKDEREKPLDKGSDKASKDDESWVVQGVDVPGKQGKENSDLTFKAREQARQKELMELEKLDGEVESFVAFDVQQAAPRNSQNDGNAQEETDMIKQELGRKFARERAVQRASCPSYIRFLVFVLECINSLPIINLDKKIKQILKQYS